MAPDRRRREQPPGTDPAPERLDLAILGEQPTLTALEVASETGVTIDQSRRLWRALGFPDQLGERAFTRADADALRGVVGIVDSGAVDFDVAVNMTRGVGQTMARLADWEVATLASRVEEIEAGPDASGSRVDTALRLIGDI